MHVLSVSESEYAIANVGIQPKGFKYKFKFGVHKIDEF